MSGVSYPEDDSLDLSRDFLRPGQQKDVLRNLRRFAPPERDHLDLHGFTTATALPELQRFIHSRQRKEGQTVVLVIHGQGHNSPDGKPVLKVRVRKWLQDLTAVLAYCADGPGAVKVLLKGR
jgi:DNA-nicking Smr family endonuclease